MRSRVRSLALLTGLTISRCRRGSDPALLWLWRRPVATAPNRPLAWEPPYAAGAAQRNSKKTNKQTNKRYLSQSHLQSKDPLDHMEPLLTTPHREGNKELLKSPPICLQVLL